MRVLRYLTPEYYQENYSTVYALKGNEAGVEFELLLNDYMGDAEINAGNLLPTALETADGTVIQGYVLTATEISVSTLTVETNVPVNGYKRFDYSEDVGDIAYLTITVPDGSGGTVKYMFEVGDPIRPTPTPAPTTSYSTLQSGSTGSSVMRLQERLIELGYLDDTAAVSYTHLNIFICTLPHPYWNRVRIWMRFFLFSPSFCRITALGNLIFCSIDISPARGYTCKYKRKNECSIAVR